MSKTPHLDRFEFASTIYERIKWLLKHDFKEIEVAEYGALYWSLYEYDSTRINDYGGGLTDLMEALNFLEHETLLKESDLQIVRLRDRVLNKIKFIENKCVKKDPESWPERVLKIQPQKKRTFINLDKSALDQGLLAYIHSYPKTTIGTFWTEIKRKEGVLYDLNYSQNTNYKDEERIKKSRAELLLGAFEILDIDDSSNVKKQHIVKLEYITPEGDHGELLELARDTIAKKLNEIKKDHIKP